MGLRATLLVLSLLCPVMAAAQPALEIVGPIRPPYVSEIDGKPAGPALDLARRIAADAGLTPNIRILPFQRAVLQLDLGGTLYPALLRTPQREARYAWIGMVHADQAVFFTRAGMAAIDTQEQARQVAQIGVLRGSELLPMLQSYGLDNIHIASSEAENARLLQAGRITAWFALNAVGLATTQELGMNAAEFRTGASFAQLSFWVVASPGLPPALIDALRDGYARLRQSGEYDRIMLPLTRLGNRS